MQRRRQYTGRFAHHIPAETMLLWDDSACTVLLILNDQPASIHQIAWNIELAWRHCYCCQCSQISSSHCPFQHKELTWVPSHHHALPLTLMPLASVIMRGHSIRLHAFTKLKSASDTGCSCRTATGRLNLCKAQDMSRAQALTELRAAALLPAISMRTRGAGQNQSSKKAHSSQQT